MTGDPERPRYGPRAAFALRPSAEAVEASGLAQTALDRPKFAELAPAEDPAAEARPDRPEPRPRRREPARPSRSTRAILVLAVATLAAVTGAGFGVWLVTQVAR